MVRGDSFILRVLWNVDSLALFACLISSVLDSIVIYRIVPDLVDILDGRANVLIHELTVFSLVTVQWCSHIQVLLLAWDDMRVG